MQMGDKARDKITGFEGIVIGRTTWMTGCDQYCLSPAIKDDGGYRESRWFDVARLEVTHQKAVNIPKPVTAAEGG